MADTVSCEICQENATDANELERHMITVHNCDNEYRAKRSIFVEGLLNSVTKNEYLQFFSTFGKIVDSFFEGSYKYLILEYEKEETVKRLCKRPIKYQNNLVQIRPQVMKGHDGRKFDAQKLEPCDFVKIQKQLWPINNFDDQLSKLISLLCLPVSEMSEKYNRLCHDLHNALCMVFPQCRIYPFGSTVTGLGFRHSDVDAYVAVWPPFDSLQVAYGKAKKALYKSRKFANIIAIPKAKTPIIKCVHLLTGISCDFNFKNMLGVCNSQLITHFLNIDPRLRPMMIIIKYWAKVHEVTQSGVMSNYSLVMLLFFFLQQPHINMLPPIASLQHDVDYLQEGWNGGFNPNPNLLPPNTCQMNIRQLLQAFFEYYQTFEFGLNVICPLMGRTIPKSHFDTPAKLPEEQARYVQMLDNIDPIKVNRPACIQDPFELSHNILRSISLSRLSDFQQLCKISADICRAADDDKLLPQLLMPKLLQPISHESHIFLPIDTDLLDIEDIDFNELNDEERIKKWRSMWYDCVNQFLVHILKNVFLLDVTVKEHEQAKKFQKLDNQIYLQDSNVVDSVVFHCVSMYNIWEFRKSAAKKIVIENKSSMQKEIEISEYIKNKRSEEKITEGPFAEFEVVYKAKINPTGAQITVNNIQSRMDFTSLVALLRKHIVGLFKDFMTPEEIEQSEEVQTEKNECDTPDVQ